MEKEIKTKIQMFNGMPVEIPVLDEEGEEKRANMNAWAKEEYDRTGTLTSSVLRERLEEFDGEVELHVVMERGQAATDGWDFGNKEKGKKKKKD